MNVLLDHHTSCPYCGEAIHLLVDCSVSEQRYIEDCEVCCRPITICTQVDSKSDVSIRVSGENDVY